MTALEERLGYSFRNRALLGISKPVIKAHGSSDARAIRSAVRQAITFIDSDVIGSIEKNVAYMRISPNEGE